VKASFSASVFNQFNLSSASISIVISCGQLAIFITEISIHYMTNTVDLKTNTLSLRTGKLTCPFFMLIFSKDWRKVFGN
jgi:hypothetical protein